VVDALSIREDYRPINSLSVLENQEVTITILEAHDKDDLFRDIAACFCDDDEKIRSELLSTMNWYSVDPRSKLLYFIREGE
jgi:hypothetical protein